MKKIIALALSLMMLLGCVSALAEAAEKDTITMVGAFTVTYAMTVVTDTEMEYEAIFTSEDAKKPMIDLLMCFSDEWSGVETWADATPEDVEAVKESFYEVTEMDDGDITFEDSTTGKGTPILIAKGADGSFAAAYTIFKSHEIELDIFPGEEQEAVTDEDVARIIEFVTDIEFAPVEK